MITIIASIQRAHLDNIRRGIKSYELRKTVPKRGMPFRVLCCESGSGGQIKCEFVCESVHRGKGWRNVTRKGVCLSEDQIRGYVGENPFYEWKISNLIDYSSADGFYVRNISDYGIMRAPQSWCYVKQEGPWRF